MGRGAAGAFAATASTRYVPVAGVHATRECDTIVRLSSSAHHSLHAALLSANGAGAVRLATPADLGPHVWLEASMALDAALYNAPSSMSPAALLAAYSSTLEASTCNLEHEFLAQPVLSIIGVWVGEQDVLAHLESVSPTPLFHLQNTTATATAATSSSSSSPLPGNRDDQSPPTRIVLVARSGFRQDDAALLDARAIISAKLPPESITVLRLGDDFPADDPESLQSVMDSLGTAAAANLNALLRKVSAEAERVRRAARSPFKSWFGVAAGPKQMPSVSSTIGLGTTAAGTSMASTTGGGGGASYADSASSLMGRAAAPAAAGGGGGASISPATSDSSRGASPGGVRHLRRRTASMNGVIPTPLFPPDSVESLSRHQADLLLLAGDYEGAGEAYRTLAGEVTGCSGPASVHEASAVEHAAIALALADGSKREVGSGLERSVKLYARAGRRELAVRTALRAAAYCVDAGFPDSAAGVLDRALNVTFPNIASSRAASSGAFAESAAAILYARTAFMFVRMGRRRKASLYAYMAASRLSHESFHAAAAVIARDIDESALIRPEIQEEVELLFGRAALALSEPERAESHFSGVMARATESTDVEVQSRAILGFFDAIGKRAAAGGSQATIPRRRWDAGALFPLVDLQSASVITADVRSARKFLIESSSSGGEFDCDGLRGPDPFAPTDTGDSYIRKSDSSLLDLDDEMRLWEALENDVLQDVEYFDTSNVANIAGKPTPKRERPVEDVISDLRREKEIGKGVDPGGSLESKISRMRESAATDSRRRRRSSLLDTGAVVGEVLTLQLTLRNPLQFPIFVEEACPVVTLNGKVIDALSDDHSSNVSRKPSGVSIKPADEIVIMPVSSKSVKLDVVVKQSGSIRFIGARWKFSVGRSTSAQDGNSMAAGFCLLDRRGPRLNATRKQRASEVPMYGEDLSLKLEVIPPAPLLEMRFAVGEDDDDLRSILDDGSVVKLKAGQKFQTSITITNCGQHPVDRLVYRIGTPHSLFLDVSSSEDFQSIVHEEDATKSSAVSSTVAGCLSCRLEPGESLDKPVWLFGSGGGETDVRLAIGYGDRVRVSRLSCKLVVGPSLNIFPRFIRRMAPPAQTVLAAPESLLEGKIELPGIGDVTKQGKEAFLLGIEVEYSGKAQGDVSFTVDSVSVASLVGWDVQKLPCLALPAGCEHLSDTASRSRLRVNETSTLFLIISRPDDEDAEIIRSQMITSTVSLVRQSDAPQDSEIQESQGGSRASEHFLLTSGYAQRMGSTSWKAVHTSVRWRSSHGHEGDLYLAPLDPGHWIDAEDTPEEDSSLDELPGTSPVEARVVHQKKVSHAFQCTAGESGYVVPAVVPVDLFIRNTCDVLLDVDISAPVAGGIADGDRGRFWAGLVDASLRAIPPGLERRICFSAILDSPGKFDLAKLVVKVRRHRGLAASAEPVQVSRTLSREVHTCELVPSYVVVEDTSEVSNLRRHGSVSPSSESDAIPCRQEEPVVMDLMEVPCAREGDAIDVQPSVDKPPVQPTGKAKTVEKESILPSQSLDSDSAWNDGDSSADDLM